MHRSQMNAYAAYLPMSIEYMLACWSRMHVEEALVRSCVAYLDAVFLYHLISLGLQLLLKICTEFFCFYFTLFNVQNFLLTTPLRIDLP
jgi:hypothetical protein